MEEAETKAIRAVEIWRSSPEFDALAQDAYVVALKEIVKYICQERPRFDMAFLEGFLEEQRRELKRLSASTGVWISPADEDIREDAPAPQNPPAS